MTVDLFNNSKPTAPAVANRAANAAPSNKNKNKNKKEKKKNNKNTKTLVVQSRPPPRVGRPNKGLKKVPQNALSVVRSAFSPPIPRPQSLVSGRHIFDLRNRSVRANLAIKVAKLFKGSPAAGGFVRDILSGVFAGAEKVDGGYKLTSFERADLEPLEGGNSAEAAAEELYPRREKQEHLPKIHEKSMIAKLEDGMVKDELESNALGHLYLDSLLQPCKAPNPGVPDQENRSLSMKIRVRTVYLLPMTNNSAYIVVSRNPARHIQIEVGGGASAFQGPFLEMNTAANVTTNLPWYDSAGKEFIKTKTFVSPGLSTVVPVSQGHDRKLVDDEFTDIDGNTLDLISVGYNNGSELVFGKMLACAAGDTFNVKAWTSDTTANNYKVFANFLTRVGSADPVVSLVESATLTGSGTTLVYSLNTSVTAPANAIGVLSYGVTNQGAVGTTTVFPRITGALSLATTPLSYPIGSSDLTDIGLLVDQANDVRVVGCRATLTYVAKKLEGGYVVGGQLPQAGDDVIPEGSLSTLAVIPGMVPRPLNGITPGISFPIFPLNATENDYHPIGSLWDDDSFSEGAIEVVTTGADADLIILQTEMSLQARTERQVLMATVGEVDARAVSDVQTFIARRGPLAFVTGNDEHEVAAERAVRDYAREHPTYSFFNGWFSGNSADVTTGDVTVV